ncbi:peroxidase family 2 domain protein [Ceratobasidium sp. AG-Ba]|nr:peroxidase family 2 domain protein [Ceratobasidium sp. AG-Ba]
MSFVVSLVKGILDPIYTIGVLLGLVVWDGGLHVANFFLPKKPIGAVVPLGTGGHGGRWGEYRPPRKGDARSPCPAINALANHGILPHNGRGFTWVKFLTALRHLPRRKELGQAVRHTYNLSPTLCIQVPWITAKLLFNGRDWNEQMTLDDLNAHGGIEHDASYTRADVKWQPDQSVPNPDIIRGLYEHAGLDFDNLKPTDTFKLTDFSDYLAYRQAHSKVFNGQYLMNSNGKMFSVANSAIAFDVFGGNAADLKTWFIEERMPDNWEPRYRHHYGFTIAQLNLRSFQLKRGISRAGNLEERVKKDAKTM